MSELKPPLLKLPLEILNQITKDFDIRTVCNLRKTCQQLRRYVDNNTNLFDSKVASLIFRKEGQDIIEIHLSGSDDRDFFLIRYEKWVDGCRVTYKDRVKLLENCDFAEVAGNDIGLILKNQKSVMSQLSITVMEGTGSMLTSLVSHLETISVEHLEFKEVTDQEHIMSLLPHLNPNTLDYFRVDSTVPLEMDLIVETEQWKVCNTWFSGATCNTSLSNFHHFKSAHFHLDQVSSNDLFLLKEAKLQNPPSRYFNFKYNHLIEPRSLKKLLGEPHPAINYGYQRWFYRIPGCSDKALVLQRNARGRRFELHVQNISDIPADAFN